MNIIELQPLTNFQATHPTDINNQGQVVGMSWAPSQQATSSHQATLWVNGIPTPLSDSPNPTEARRINDQGEVLYVEESNSAYTYFLWKEGAAVDLDTAIPGFRAVDLNDQRQLLGFGPDVAIVHDLNNNTQTTLPPISFEGKLQTPTLIGIDNAGRVVGVITTFLIDISGTELSHVYWLPAGGTAWVKTDLTTVTRPSLSKSGLILGSVTDGAGSGIGCWYDLNFTELRYIPRLSQIGGVYLGLPFDANGTGLIVGCEDWGKPFRYDMNSNVIEDLNDYFDSPWVASQARGINEEGQVIGIGTMNWGTPAFQDRGWLISDLPRPKPKWHYQVTIDRLAIILTNEMYATLKKPNPPPLDVFRGRVRELVRSMGPEERRRALAQVKVFDAYEKALVS
jgi:uncharacterized membrane protein